MEWLATTFALYRTALTRAVPVALANWPVAASLFAYLAITTVTAIVASRLGIVGGFIVSLVWSACMGSFLHLVEMMVRTSRVSFDDFRRSFGAYLWDVVGVSFFLWIFWMIVTPLVAGSQHGVAIVLSLNLLIFVLFNAVPELIYFGHHSSLELFGESYRFVSENWIEWFPPNLIFGAALWFAFNVPLTGWGNLLVLAGSGFFLYFVMVFRGFLFQELAGSSRRSRAFRYRMQG